MRVVTTLCFALVLVVSSAMGGLACGTGSSGSVGSAQRSPSEVLRQFLAAMDQSASDDRALRVAYELLASPAQKSLEARAARVKTLAGQSLEPWQMLAQGRFRLRFSPASRRGMKGTSCPEEPVSAAGITRQHARRPAQRVPRQRWSRASSRGLPKLVGISEAPFSER